jgi:cytochrome P450
MVPLPASRIVRVDPTTKESDMTTTEPIRTVRRHSIAGVCAQLGVPQKDWHLFRRWAGESLNSKALDALHAYIDVMIAERCRMPGDDLLSRLIQLEVDGEELTVDDIHTFVAALVAGAS